MLVALTTLLALAADPPEDPAPLAGDPVAAIGAPELQVDFSETDAAPTVTVEQQKFLKPKRQRLPQNPYAQVDFTAYTLEWGETKLGIAGIHFGLAPRVQIGSQPVLNLVGLYNGTAKFNAVRAGPLELALSYQGYYMPLGEFEGAYHGAGALTSMRLTVPWTLHIGAQYGQIELDGIPDRPPAIMQSYIDTDLMSAYATQLVEQGVDPHVEAQGVLLKVTTDLRFNRRDSIVLQGQSFTWGRVDADLGSDVSGLASEVLGQIVPGASGANFSAEQQFSLTEAYVLTVSYQMSWEKMDLRMGLGVADNPIPWLLQGNDVSTRFGGKTRITDRKRRKGWRLSKKGDDHSLADADSAPE